MKTEYEATFYPVEKDEIRDRLEKVRATRVYPERLMRRVTFHLPESEKSAYKWARVRDEGDKITMSVKEMQGGSMEGQKEEMVVINSFEDGVTLLTALGCVEKAYQETKRELWMLDGCEVTIDEWPFLDPMVEVEGKSEEAVRAASERLSFSWSEAKFLAAGAIYREKYGVSEDFVNQHVSRIVFDGPNPFLNG